MTLSIFKCMHETNNPHIIYHHPHPVTLDGMVGSQVRPVQMLLAFQQLGFQVEAVTGYAPERRQAMERVKQLIQKGEKFAFIYSESINKPMLLAERMHLAEPEYTNAHYLKWLLKDSPFMDFSFFKAMQDTNIPVGWFCRDIYWQFEFYHRQRPFFQRNFHTALYNYDWRRLQKLVTHLFLPDEAMKEKIPVVWPDEAVSPLPPGATLHELPPVKKLERNSPLKLFYVGGTVPPNYDLTPGFDVLREVEGVQFTLCCRASEWQVWRTHYDPPANTDVVHENGSALKKYYHMADLFYMVRDPFDYLKYTMPIKVFEALGYGLPIMTLSGTVAADFVAEHDVGWVAETTAELKRILTRLQKDRTEIKQKRDNVAKIREKHTWQIRAQMVAEKLLP